MHKVFCPEGVLHSSDGLLVGDFRWIGHGEWMATARFGVRNGVFGMDLARNIYSRLVYTIYSVLVKMENRPLYIRYLTGARVRYSSGKPKARQRARTCNA